MKQVYVKVNGQKVFVTVTDEVERVPFAEELLLNERQKQKERQELYDLGYNRKYLDYVCVDEIGTLVKPSTLSCSFRCLLEKNGLPIIRFHELRHSCASLLIESGFSMKQVQEWLGHSTYVTTADIYSHLDFSNKVTVGKTIGEMFSGDFAATVQDEQPTETILQGKLSDDDNDDTIIDEYDTDNKVEPLSASMEISEERVPMQIEITEQEYADYLKWKRQMAKSQTEM